MLQGLDVEKKGPGRKEYNRSWCSKDYKFIRSREQTHVIHHNQKLISKSFLNFILYSIPAVCNSNSTAILQKHGD